MEYIIALVALLIGVAIGFFFDRLRLGAAYKQRDELRQQERRLEKREAMVDEAQDAYLKKERMLEATQAKLAERNKSIEAKERELGRLLKEEQEQLYKISEL